MNEEEKVSVLTDFPYSKEIISLFAALAAIGVVGGLVHGVLDELDGYYRLKGILGIISKVPAAVWSLASIGGALALYIPLMNSMKKIVPSVGILWTLFIVLSCLEEAMGFVSDVAQLLFSIAGVVIMIILGVKINKSFGGKISTFGTVFWVCPLIALVTTLILAFCIEGVDSLDTFTVLLYAIALVVGLGTYLPLIIIREFAASDLETEVITENPEENNQQPEN